MSRRIQDFLIKYLSDYSLGKQIVVTLIILSYSMIIPLALANKHWPEGVSFVGLIGFLFFCANVLAVVLIYHKKNGPNKNSNKSNA